MRLQRFTSYLRNSLWFIPALAVLGSALLAFGMLLADALTPDIARSLPLVFGGGPDGARSVLSSIAASAITVAGVTFSITIVALQLASSQFSPRVLRNFMRDRVSQAVLGSFIGAFLYSVLVLRSIRVEADGNPAFVPALAVTVGIGMAILAVVMLIYFIHHISTRIQVTTIVSTIAEETVERIEREWQAPDADEPPRVTLPDEPPQLVAADASGYLQLVDRDGLVKVATELDLVVRLDHRPGEWVQEAAPAFSVWPADVASPELARRLMRNLTLGAERSLEQDAAFGIRQLVDVAVKALSPGINDPTSAADCIHRLTQILVAMGRRRPPREQYLDDDGRLRLVISLRDYELLVSLAFDEIRQYGATTPAIALAVATAVETTLAALPVERHAPLRRQLDRLLESTHRIEPPSDRQRVEARLRALLAA